MRTYMYTYVQNPNQSNSFAHPHDHKDPNFYIIQLYPSHVVGPVPQLCPHVTTITPSHITLLPCISHSVVCLTLSLDSPVRKSQILGFGNTIFSSFLSALTIYNRKKYIHTYIHTYMHTYIHTYIHACMHSLGYHMHTQHVHPVYMHLQPTRTIHYMCVSLPLFQMSILSSA